LGSKFGGPREILGFSDFEIFVKSPKSQLKPHWIFWTFLGNRIKY